MADRIALLGWGSLLWEGGNEFEACHDPWQDDGPSLRIEFCRISASRNGALTLVIDPENGVPTRVAYCLSRRSNIEEVIEDLRTRERTTARNIGTLGRVGEARCHDPGSQEAILSWLAGQDVDGVVWTDLRSNFAQKQGQPFSVASALAYLQALDPEARKKAIEYIHKAPQFVRTPLRDALANLT